MEFVYNGYKNQINGHNSIDLKIENVLRNDILQNCLTLQNENLDYFNISYLYNSNVFYFDNDNNIKSMYDESITDHSNLPVYDIIKKKPVFVDKSNNYTCINTDGTSLDIKDINVIIALCPFYPTSLIYAFYTKKNYISEYTNAIALQKKIGVNLTTYSISIDKNNNSDFEYTIQNESFRKNLNFIGKIINNNEDFTTNIETPILCNIYINFSNTNNLKLLCLQGNNKPDNFYKFPFQNCIFCTPPSDLSYNSFIKFKGGLLCKYCRDTSWFNLDISNNLLTYNSLVRTFDGYYGNALDKYLSNCFINFFKIQYSHKHILFPDYLLNYSNSCSIYLNDNKLSIVYSSINYDCFILFLQGSPFVSTGIIDFVEQNSNGFSSAGYDIEIEFELINGEISPCKYKYYGCF